MTAPHGDMAITYWQLVAEMLIDPLDETNFGAATQPTTTMRVVTPSPTPRDPSERWTDLDTDRGQPT